MSEWVKLYDTEQDSDVYVNLAQASSIYPFESGSAIWLLEHPDWPEMGRICVKESPVEIFKSLHEVPSATRP